MIRVTSLCLIGGRFIVRMENGRSYLLDPSRFPRLSGASMGELLNYRLIGRGVGVHWPALDEDLHAEDLACGDPLPV